MSLRRTVTAVALGFCALVAHATAEARVRTVEIGEAVELGPDEGLLIAAIDTDIGFNYAEIRAGGTGLGGERIDAVEPGRRIVLLAASAGMYRYGKLETGSSLGNIMSSRYYYDLGDDARYRCRVEARTINYCGDLRARFAGGSRTVFALRNRSAAAIAEVDKRFPKLRSRYAFRYRGRYADPYPDWLATLERSAKPAALPDELPESGRTDALAARELFKAARIRSMSINPSGSLLLERGYLGTEHIVSVIDVASGAAIDAYRGPQEPLSAAWSGNRSIVLEFEGAGAARSAIVAKSTHVPGSVPIVRAMSVPFDGYVIDPLPGDEDHILFSRYDTDRGFGLYRLDISGKRIASTQFDHKTRVGSHVKGVPQWLTDSRGEVRAILSTDDDVTTLELVKEGRVERIERGPDDEAFRAVSFDERTGDLFVITNRGRTFAELCRFKPGAAQPLTTVLAVENVDVVAAATTSSGDVIGVHYYLDGRAGMRFLDQGRHRVHAALEKAFPDAQVVPIDRSRDERLTVVRVDGPTRPPAFYLHDRDKRAIELLGHAYPALADRAFVAPKRIVAKAADGLEIEAFLFARADGRDAPLVAMPHGGPIGVFDVQHFDHEVQYLATRGYAVLQVNYRGSGGKGRALLDAGLRAAGREIEEDVVAAIDLVLTQGGLDAKRVCIAGASYGGYSALRSAMRWPERFRCAVSMSGATDLPLQFTGSDTADDDRLIALRGRWIGDPVKDADELRALSPLYAEHPIAVPVLLVHGTEDDRVPYEHSARFKRVLELRGTPVRLVTLEGEGHAYESLEAKATAWETFERFLGQHLSSAAAH